jgi:uncharacterized protein YjbI with pentapeptide repeats
MADQEQLAILQQGTTAWNNWRKRAPRIDADLTGAALRRADLSGTNLRRTDLGGADLSGANLGRADLRRADLRRAALRAANLSQADLSRADLGGADLSGADLSGAYLRRTSLGEADLSGADLSGADLRGASLFEANLREANLCEALLTLAVLRRGPLTGADLRHAKLFGTVFSDVDLSRCKNLETIHHDGPSTVDIQTLQRSGRLPLTFLRGVGLPDTLIDYLPSLLNQAIQHYSCFISHSWKDQEFAQRLHADLQDKGVRCWFAPEDMKIGAKILDALDEAIRLRDKVLLVLSAASIASDWVEDEVTKAFEEERQRGGVVLFPVRLDDAVFETKEAWAAKLRANRNIGDFRAWKVHDAYQKAFERVLRDLRVEAPDVSGLSAAQS